MSSGVSACSFALAMPFAGHSELTPCPFPALLPSPAVTVALEVGGADTYTQRAIPGSEPGRGSCTFRPL